MSQVEQLMSAAKQGDIETVKRLLSKKSSWMDRLIGRAITVHTRDKYRRQAMHHAALGGKLDLVSVLLDYGAKPDAKNKSGETPLVEALANGHLEVAEVLLAASEKKALLNSEDSPLLNFKILCRVEAVRWLIQHGATPNVADKKGETPLHKVTNSAFSMAALMLGRNPIEILCPLLEAGADPLARNLSGQLPLDMLRSAPAQIASAAKFAGGFAAKINGATEESLLLLSDTFQRTQLMQSIVEACTACPTPQQFASEAVRKATKRSVPFVLVSPIVREMIQALQSEHAGVSLSRLVPQALQALDFACPKCGPLNRQVIDLAVAAKWAQEMNPQLKPIFFGPNVASVFKGWCPECFSTSVELSFDPTRLNLDPDR